MRCTKVRVEGWTSLGEYRVMDRVFDDRGVSSVKRSGTNEYGPKITLIYVQSGPVNPASLPLIASRRVGRSRSTERSIKRWSYHPRLPTNDTESARHGPHSQGAGRKRATRWGVANPASPDRVSSRTRARASPTAQIVGREAAFPGVWQGQTLARQSTGVRPSKL